jgi:GntR family transcriptional regulator
MVLSDTSTIWPPVIDHSSPVPYYAQVKETLRGRIERGDWKPGAQLPGEPELCTMFDVSRTVIRQALTELMYEGLIVRAKGKGTFVAEPKIMENLAQKLTGFYQDMADHGNPPVSRVLKQHVIPASAKVAGFLHLAHNTPVLEIERLRFVKDEPIVLVTTFLPYDRCADLLKADLTRQSLYGVMEQHLGLVITRGHRTLEAVPANQREAELLQVDVGAPLMLLDSVSYLDDGTPIEYYHALHRGDRSRFEAELVRVYEPAR